MKKFKEGISVNQTHADAWSLMGNLHLSKNEWAPAQKKFEYILKLNEHHDDPYSFVALGNIWLESLSSPMRRKEKVLLKLSFQRFISNAKMHLDFRIFSIFDRKIFFLGQGPSRTRFIDV